MDRLAFADVTLTNFYVIITDNVDKLRSNIKFISRTPSFNEEGKFLIIFNNPETRLGGKKISLTILENLFVEYRTVNVVIAFASDAFGYELFTGDPYHGSEDLACGRMKALRIGKCKFGQFDNEFYTEKLLSIDKVPDEMHDCQFTLCARVQEPFVNEGCQDGLEIQIIHFLQEEMGFNIKTTCSELDRGEPNGDGTWSDLLGQMRNDSCDIIVGAFFPDHEVHADFAATEFYLQDYYTFYVKTADVEPRWKGLMTIFKIKAWCAFGVVLLVSWIFWLLLGIISHEPHQHRQIILTFMNVFAVSLGVSANNRPHLSSLRAFFVVLALYALTITSIYTSKLISVFTNPKLDYQIDSIEEILELDMLIGGRMENLDWFQNGDVIDEIIFERYNHSDDFRPSSKSLHKVSENEMTLLISRLYVETNKHRYKVFGLTQSMFSNSLEMIVERGFPLLHRFNHILALLRDMGLTSKLSVDFNYNMTILKPIREKQQPKQYEMNEHDDDDDTVDEDFTIVLTTEHLEGAFTILKIGLMCSSAVFLLELIFNSRIFKKIVSWICCKTK